MQCKDKDPYRKVRMPRDGNYPCLDKSIADPPTPTVYFVPSSSSSVAPSWRCIVAERPDLLDARDRRAVAGRPNRLSWPQSAQSAKCVGLV